MAGKLKSLDVDRETRPGKYSDGDGLYLIVKGATSKNWIYRYRKDGRERWLGLGSVKDVPLRGARLARAARLRVRGDRSTPGVDIVQEKRAAREQTKAVETKLTLPNFEQCAEVYIREHAHFSSRFVLSSRTRTRIRARSHCRRILEIVSPGWSAAFHRTIAPLSNPNTSAEIRGPKSVRKPPKPKR